jgi:hypothetical protein
MTHKSVIFKQKFWTMLKFIEGLHSSYPLDEFMQEVEVDEDLLRRFISFTSTLDFQIKVKTLEGVKYIVPPTNAPTVQFELSFAEWLSFQAHFPKMAEEQNEAFHNTMAEKLAEVEQEHPTLDLFKAVDEEELESDISVELVGKDKETIEAIQTCLHDNFLLEVKLQDNRVIDLFCHRLVYLDGGLSLVGEDSNDRCLVYFNVDEILSAKVSIDNDYSNNFSTMEINDFIVAIRAVTGKEERLVLKIRSQEDLDLRPEYHFLGNPYVTSNMRGDLIWAASVEVSEELFEWLLSIKAHVEILDPTSFKEEFLVYCEKKLEDEYEYKKAS